MKASAQTLTQLQEAATSIVPAFRDVNTRPVEVTVTGHVDEVAWAEVARRYHRHGFVMLSVIDVDLTAERHLELTRRLGLGAPFIPPLYSMGNKVPSLVSTISASENASTQDADHPSFGTTVGQGLHTDGTLQPAGVVKATVMSCRTPAAEGGHNGFFDAVSAFATILATDPDAAISLTSPTALLRRADINGCSDENIGPAFTVQDGRIVGRYCQTNTDSWLYGEGEAGATLRRAVDRLRAMAREGQPTYHTERLEANQAVVFDNTRLSHSRAPYRDSGHSQRCLFRTLHLTHPPEAR